MSFKPQRVRVIIVVLFVCLLTVDLKGRCIIMVKRSSNLKKRMKSL